MLYLKDACSKYFTYDDFISCGQTQHESGVDNYPKSDESISAIRTLAVNVLDKVRDEFGPLSITYGFVSLKLISEMRRRGVRRISPSLDQHSSYELNTNGKRICERGGLACDFFVHEQNSEIVTNWIIRNCEFDRLYFYGIDRPIHVSYSPELSGKVSIMTECNGKLMPRTIKKERFLEYMA